MGNYGTGVLEKKIDNHDVLIDGRKANISAKVPKQEEHSYKIEPETIYTNPRDLLESEDDIIPSLSLIRFGKIKAFIDGVYAIAEDMIRKKGHKLSRTDFLNNLESFLTGDYKKYINVCKSFGEGDFSNGNSDISMTLPQGFYDWNSNLRKVYFQIKATSKTPSFLIKCCEDSKFDADMIKSIGEIINSRPELKESYNLIKDFYSKSTDKLREEFVLFPGAVLPDQEFFINYSFATQSDLEEGLGKILIKAIRRGEVSFVPEKDSGLYTRQIHEITPLILRDSSEFEKFIPNKTYSKILEKEFISQWAGTRHTHVGHTDHSRRLIGASMDGGPFPLVIRPELKVEPFGICYERMAESLDFFEKTLVNSFGESFLEKKRFLQNGSKSDKRIGEEFENMKSMLRGFVYISKDSIHCTYNTNPKVSDDIKLALDWIKNIKEDQDLNRNTAIFVPIIRETDGRNQIAYINAGFKTIDVKVEYSSVPEIDISPFRMHKFGKNSYKLPVLVHREVRIPHEKLINDRILRKKLPETFSDEELDEIVSNIENHK